MEKENDIKAKCIVKLCEMYPLYRKAICDFFEKEEFRFTKTQQMIVMTLWLYKSMSLTQLASQISTSNEQATRAVGQLVKGGYVTKTRNEKNRRVADIKLTEKTEQIIVQTQEKIVKKVPKGLDQFNEEDARELYDSLAKVEEILMRYQKKYLAGE